ncbi:hypothetical protein SAMN04487886_10442 [Clostridium sp. DSM 8431]|nr:hypothetical protein SAMN04487886_10442 [Clostridium sp. DSM 8431]
MKIVSVNNKKENVFINLCSDAGKGSCPVICWVGWD